MVGAEGLVGKYNEYTFQTPDDSTSVDLKTVHPGKINDSACHIVSLSPREHTIHVALATVTAGASLQRVPHCKALYQRAQPPRCPCHSAPLTVTACASQQRVPHCKALYQTSTVSLHAALAALLLWHSAHF
jgi:hypothetical protein